MLIQKSGPLIFNINIFVQLQTNYSVLLPSENSEELIQRKPTEQHCANFPETFTSAMQETDDRILLSTNPHKRKVFVEKTSFSEISGNENNSVRLTANASNQDTDSRKRKRITENIGNGDKEYKSRSEKIIRAKRVTEGNCECNYKCIAKIDEPGSNVGRLLRS